MIKKIEEFIQKNHMISAGTHVIIGVSGGADSVCLLLVLSALRERFGFSLEVVHVEHGIRGAESREDASFVVELCKSLGIRASVISVDVLAYAKEKHLGIEEAARILRYEAFMEAARKSREEKSGEYREDEAELLLHEEETNRVCVALAHHMEDNAEAILFQMIRGSGLSGMTGMQTVREASEVTYIRPLLSVSRAEIEAYLAACGQEFRTDATNAELDYARNRLRGLVFPELRNINEQAVFHINRTAEHLGTVWDFLQEETKKLYPRVVVERADKIYIIIEEMQKVHLAVREEVVRKALFASAGKQKDIGTVHVELVLDLMERQSGSQIRLPYGITAEREFDRLVLFRKQEKTAKINILDVSEEVLTEGRRLLLPWTVSLSESEELQFRIFPFSGDSDKIIKKRYTKWFDYDMIKNGFQIRRREPGDYFCMDSSGHRKKLKQYLIEEKIPASQRGDLWILAQDHCVCWLVGGRISENYKVTESTTYILEIVYNR